MDSSEFCAPLVKNRKNHFNLIEWNERRKWPNPKINNIERKFIMNLSELIFELVVFKGICNQNDYIFFVRKGR